MPGIAQDNALHKYRKLPTSDDPNIVTLWPTKRPSNARQSVPIEFFHALRAEQDEFVRRLNSALRYDWRSVRPNPDTDSSSRDVELEAPGGVKLVLKRSGQARFSYHNDDRTMVIERQHREHFDVIMHRLGRASLPVEPKQPNENWGWRLFAAYFTGFGAAALLITLALTR